MLTDEKYNPWSRKDKEPLQRLNTNFGTKCTSPAWNFVTQYLKQVLVDISDETNKRRGRRVEFSPEHTEK